MALLRRLLTSISFMRFHCQIPEWSDTDAATYLMYSVTVMHTIPCSRTETATNKRGHELNFLLSHRRFSSSQMNYHGIDFHI